MELDKAGLDNRVFEAIAESTDNEYVYLCNLETNVSRWSRDAVDYFGLPGEYMKDVDLEWCQRIHPDDLLDYKREIRALRQGEKRKFSLEYRVKNCQGNYVICTGKGTLLPRDGAEPTMFVGTLVNHGIVERVDANTNLYNVYEFQRVMTQRTAEGKQSLVMMVGFNRFRNVNKVYGFAAGNEVLRCFGALMMDEIHNQGRVFRMNDSNFALYIDQGTQADARRLYAAFQDLARRKIQVCGAHIPMSISAGAVLVEGTHQKPDTIQACLAYALEQSKRVRHSELVFYQDEQAGNYRENLERLETVRQSVLSGCKGFYLCYQPLVQAQTGHVVGMEVLLRWHREPYGELSPASFIPWLEQDDCFYELGNWIIRQALRDSREILKERPDFVVNINVTYSQLEKEDFRSSLMAILEEEQFPPENLYLELTERFQPTDVEQIRDLLEFFEGKGIRVALDDFGTGTASLNLLRQLPIDCLKIDRTFISEIETNRTDEVIVEMVIDNARKLGLSVCLEGIENQHLRDYVRQYKANTHQGYYYSRPVRIDQFRQYLEKSG
jgi:EAL domain-containing protein (putative c-di-GMP-specific phosphodiesterase class I)/GGDEF domain-containing protein